LLLVIFSIFLADVRLTSQSLLCCFAIAAFLFKWISAEEQANCATLYDLLMSTITITIARQAGRQKTIKNKKGLYISLQWDHI
jgi:hypothetical protein